MKKNSSTASANGLAHWSASWMVSGLVAASPVAQPTITTHPKSQSVSLGANVLLQVRATGTAPLSYQWWFASGEIAGAVTNALSLTNVSVSAAGEYLAVVSDATGLSSTSRVATLSVDPAFTKITRGGTVTNLTGTLEFTDSDAANQLRRFYRAALK